MSTTELNSIRGLTRKVQVSGAKSEIAADGQVWKETMCPGRPSRSACDGPARIPGWTDRTEPGHPERFCLGSASTGRQARAAAWSCRPRRARRPPACPPRRGSRIGGRNPPGVTSISISSRMVRLRRTFRPSYRSSESPTAASESRIEKTTRRTTEASPEAVCRCE